MCSLIFFYYSNIIYQFYITCMSLSCIIFYGSIISQNLSVFIIMDRQVYLFYFNSVLTIFRKVIRTIELSNYRAFGLLDFRTFRLLGFRTNWPTPKKKQDNFIITDPINCVLFLVTGYKPPWLRYTTYMFPLLSELFVDNNIMLGKGNFNQ